MRKIYCKLCKETKPTSEYYLEKRKYGNYHRPHCKKCIRSRAKKNYCPNKHKDKNIKANYGISYEDYLNLLKKQKGKCRICKKSARYAPKGRLCIDHCHETSKIRGLLCISCNLGLGQFQDNKEYLKSAIDYLGGSY